MRRRFLPFAALGLILAATACTDARVSGEVVPADQVCAEIRAAEVDGFYAINDTYVDDEAVEWETSSPEDVGLDSAPLEAAAQNLALSEDVASLLVIRHGRLAFERYFNGNEATYANNVHSLSKSILSAVAGIAVAEGRFDIDDTIGDLLPESMTGANRDITVKDLLTLAGGLEWAENETEFDIDGDHSHVAAILAQPRIATPGTEFLYNTGLTQTLSAVLDDRIEGSLCEYAHERLFEPLGIDVDHWKVDPDGYFAGGHSVFLTPREVAVFGQMVLQEGFWKKEQLVRSDWLRESLSPTWDLECDLGEAVHVRYGYLWWLYDLDGLEVWTADGYAGQRLFVIPDLDMVVVLTHMTHKGDGIEVVSPIALLRSHIAHSVLDVEVPQASDCTALLKIYEIHDDGTGVRRLDVDASRVLPWSLSLDGARLAFHADVDVNFEVYTSALDATERKRLTNEYSPDVLPDWSLDGDSIVFSRGEAGSGDLYSVNPDGTGLAQLTDLDGGETSPSWSPDGNRVAFIKETEGSRGFGGPGELWVLDLATGDTDLLLDGPVYYPDWSPDGERIVFAASTDDGPRVATLDVGTGEVRDLGPGFFPRWSPDGERIAYVEDGSDGQELFVIAAGGGERFQVTDHPSRVVYALWSGPANLIFVADSQPGDRTR